MLFEMETFVAELEELGFEGGWWGNGEDAVDEVGELVVGDVDGHGELLVRFVDFCDEFLGDVVGNFVDVDGADDGVLFDFFGVFIVLGLSLFLLFLYDLFLYLFFLLLHDFDG